VRLLLLKMSARDLEGSRRSRAHASPDRDLRVCSSLPTPSTHARPNCLDSNGRVLDLIPALHLQCHLSTSTPTYRSQPAYIPPFYNHSSTVPIVPTSTCPRKRGTIAMPRQPKRPRVIDLTSDGPDEAARPAKSPRYPSSSYSSQPSAPGSSQTSIARSHMPSSSAPVPPSSAGQQLSSQILTDDDGEPSSQDLTQSDDGPSLELYGSLGV
jgi:hypothetical protein